MTETTTRFGLPLIQVGQAQKEVTHNAALFRLDAYMHLAVRSRSIGAPPTSPAAGETWIVGGPAAGAWAGQESNLAEWTGAAWGFLIPTDGLMCWIADEAVVGVRGGGVWNVDFLPVGGLRIGGAEMLGAPRATIAEPTGGTVIDVAARTAIGELLSYLRLQGIVGS